MSCTVKLMEKRAVSRFYHIPVLMIPQIPREYTNSRHTEYIHGIMLVSGLSQNTESLYVHTCVTATAYLYLSWNLHTWPDNSASTGREFMYTLISVITENFPCSLKLLHVILTTCMLHSDEAISNLWWIQSIHVFGVVYANISALFTLRECDFQAELS